MISALMISRCLEKWYWILTVHNEQYVVGSACYLDSVVVRRGHAETGKQPEISLLESFSGGI
jgi:hypothetical protein